MTKFKPGDRAVIEGHHLAEYNGLEVGVGDSYNDSLFWVTPLTDWPYTDDRTEMLFHARRLRPLLPAVQVGERVRIVSRSQGRDWNGEVGTVVENNGLGTESLTAVDIDGHWRTLYFDGVEKIAPEPVDGGTYVLDADGLDALGVGAKIETRYGIEFDRYEDGWKSRDWSSPFSSRSVVNFYTSPYRVLDEGAPVVKPTVDGGTYVLDREGLFSLGEGALIEGIDGVQYSRIAWGWKITFINGRENNSGLVHSTSDIVRDYYTPVFRVLNAGAPLIKPEPITYTPGTVLVVQDDGSLKVVHKP